MEFKKVHRQIKPSTPTLPSKSVATPPVTSPPIQLSEPAVKKPHFSQLFTRRLFIIAGAFMMVAIAGALFGSIFQKDDTVKSSSKNPEFQTILPNNKSATDVGGWKRVSPPENDPVFAYTDIISGIAISVSQQPLPESFNNNVNGHVADLAKKFNATNKINVNDTAVYIGTSAKGPQSVIFTKQNLLVLIKSQNKIDDIAWESYVASLTLNP